MILKGLSGSDPGLARKANQGREPFLTTYAEVQSVK